MTERELTQAVVEICRELGLLWHHCERSTYCRGPAGFPDLVIAGHNGILIVELKSAEGETTGGQDLWRWTLARAIGTRAQIWRPADLEAGRIRAALEAIR